MSYPQDGARCKCTRGDWEAARLFERVDWERIAGCRYVLVAFVLAVWCALGFLNWAVVRLAIYPLFSASRPHRSGVYLSSSGASVLALFELLVALALASHLRATLSDPSSRARWSRSSEMQSNYCFAAGNELTWTCSKDGCAGRHKPPRAHHCSRCRTCVFKMDHHCFYVNNCVGHANQKYFILFLFYEILTAIFALVLFACTALSLSAGQHTHQWYGDDTVYFINVGMLSSAAALSAWVTTFTIGYFRDQLEAIRSNATLVETVKGIRGQKLTFRASFEAVFGSSWWLWPFPIASTPLCDLAEPVFSIDETTSSDSDMVLAKDPLSEGLDVPGVSTALSFGEEDSSIAKFMDAVAPENAAALELPALLLQVPRPLASGAAARKRLFTDTATVPASKKLKNRY